MNKVILSGRLVADPETKYFSKDNGEESAVSRYTLAVQRIGNKEEHDSADFVRCVCFGARASFCEKYLKKGMKMLVSGYLHTGSFKDKDGKTVYTTDVYVDEQEFAETKKKENETNYVSGDDLPFN
jgi:single-strand binding protein